VRARLLRLHVPDAESLKEYVPEDPEAFGLLVQAMVGPDDGPGEESFDFVVCTPRWFDARPFDKGFAWPRHHLFLKRWDYATVERAIGDVVGHAEGADWSSVANQIARYGCWEFDDYRE
jgi:Immunity protein 8